MEGFASGADPDKELLHASQTAADLEGKFMSVTEVLPCQYQYSLSPAEVLFSVFTETRTG